jgi:arabinogalactan oligomer / maltooligosaccharide transport system substrate-binding protein
MKKKLLASMMTAALAVGSLAACGPKDNTTSSTDNGSTDSGENKPEKLVVWEDKDRGPAIEAAIKSFEEKYGIKVEYKEVPMLDQQDKLRLDGPNLTGADVVTLPHDRIGPLVTEGLIVPLHVDEEVVNQFTESSIQAMTFDGELYGLPKSTETPVLIYNKALLEKAPETMDELYSFAKDFSKDGKYGFLALWDNFYFAHGVIGGFGGYVFGDDNGVPNPQDLGLNNDGAVEGAEYIAKWYQEGLFPNGIIGENGGQTLDGLFTEGKVAAVMNGPWAFQGYREAGIDIGVAPLPTLPNGEHVKTFIGVKGWYVSSFSKHPEWAQKLVEHITNAENAKIRFELTGEIPPVKSLIEDPVIAEDEAASAVAIQSGYGVPMPNIPEMGEVWDPMASALQLTVTGKQEPAKALDEAVKAIEQQIQTNHQ